MLFPIIYDRLAGRVELLDFIIALGTHLPMNEEQICERVGIQPDEQQTVYSKARFFNHAWDDPEQLTEIGVMSSDEISQISDGIDSNRPCR